VKWAAVIVAAGRGTRFGRPKQLLELAGEPMVVWSVLLLSRIGEVEAIVVATEPEWLPEVERAVTVVSPIVRVVAGGATRQASVHAALAAVPSSCDAVLVHDGARPLVRKADVLAGMSLVQPGHGSLLAVPVVDTVKVVERHAMIVTQTLARESLWAAQTPQFATLRDFRQAHEDALLAGITAATDDAVLLERAGTVVHVVPGSDENFKVTLGGDLARAHEIMKRRLMEDNSCE